VGLQADNLRKGGEGELLSPSEKIGIHQAHFAYDFDILLKMKCELCHEKAAEVAITVSRNGAEEELYVCKTCAQKERTLRQKKSQRTRKVTGLPPGVSMSITEVKKGDAPPFIEALMEAMMDDLEKATEQFGKEVDRFKREVEGKNDDAFKSVALDGVDKKFLFLGRLHLEALRLIGELEPSQRALHALGMRLRGIEEDGVKDVAHIYEVEVEKVGGDREERAKRVLTDLVAQEGNARRRLTGDLKRIFSDALCRALAVMKNCRLVTAAEVIDMLSPLKIGAQEKLLDGITLREIEELAERMRDELECGVGGGEMDGERDQAERDREDAERADEMNARFEDVLINEE